MSGSILADLIIISLVGLSVVVSFIRGFVKEMISLISWVVAAYLAVVYCKKLGSYFTFTDVEAIRIFIAFLLIFVPTVFVGAIVNMIIGGFVRKTPFSFSDRVIGILFGVFRGALFLTLGVLLAGLTALPKEPWWQNSYLIPPLQSMAIWFRDILPPDIAKSFDFEPKSKEKSTKGDDLKPQLDKSEIITPKALKPVGQKGQNIDKK